MDNSTLVLASASPRRRELLALLGVPFKVRPVDVDEDPVGAGDPQIAARTLARTKAEAARLLDTVSPILAADTVVSFENRLLAKPRNPGEAREMLAALRGRTHKVVTAVVLLPANRPSGLARHPVTAVTMRRYSDADIEASIARGDPFDKAGGYGIQDTCLNPVAVYDGCYCNVVGLPLLAVTDILDRVGLTVPVPYVLLPQCRGCPLQPGSSHTA